MALDGRIQLDGVVVAGHDDGEDLARVDLLAEEVKPLVHALDDFLLHDLVDLLRMLLEVFELLLVDAAGVDTAVGELLLPVQHLLFGLELYFAAIVAGLVVTLAEVDQRDERLAGEVAAEHEAVALVHGNSADPLAPDGLGAVNVYRVEDPHSHTPLT